MNYFLVVFVLYAHKGYFPICLLLTSVLFEKYKLFASCQWFNNVIVVIWLFHFMWQNGQFELKLFGFWSNNHKMYSFILKHLILNNKTLWSKRNAFNKHINVIETISFLQIHLFHQYFIIRYILNYAHDGQSTSNYHTHILFNSFAIQYGLLSAYSILEN